MADTATRPERARLGRRSRAAGHPVPPRGAACCPAPSAPSARATARVALVGNPNVGKSTLFNALTGAAQTVGNWPGKTVHVAEGTWASTAPGGRPVTLVDLPGTYSLVPASPDEELTRDVLVGAVGPGRDVAAGGRPDLVVVALDAANLARNLYLLSQVLDCGLPVVVALTMADVAAGRGVLVDPERLARAVGVPVVAVCPRDRSGVDGLAGAVTAALAAPRPPRPAHLGEEIEAELAGLTAGPGPDGGQPGAWAGARTAVGTAPPARWAALTRLVGDDPGAADARHRLLVAASRDGDVGDAGSAGGPTDLDDLEDLLDVDTLVAERRYAWAHVVLAAAVDRHGAGRTTWSDRVDRVVTSRWTGLPVFLAVMWGVFTATTTLAAPLQDGLQALLDGPVTTGTARLLDLVGARGGLLRGLVLDGLVSGVGQLLTFVPLMAIMFVLLALLEDSGYLARAAFVVDRLMRLVGLPGRAFLPLIVGFGCNVPALAGTRILPDARHRMLTGMLVPYVTCSARLTVYVLLSGVFFRSGAGTVVFAMYVLSIVLVVLVGLLLRRTLFRGMAREPLVLELPPYRRPTLRVIGTQTWQKLAGFLRTAGGIIVATVTAVWLLTSIPLGAAAGTTFGNVPIEQSVFGRVSQAVAPAFAPAGFGDWHASSALITGFVAKEAVVATQAQTYSAAEPTDLHAAGDLGTALRASFDASSGGHAVPAVLAFMVFLLAYTPCMATVAAQRAEIGTRLTLVGMGVQLAVAWGLAVLVFQLGRLL